MTYLRYPSIVGDTIVFVADDDVWRVDAGGGAAERLTSDRAPASRPRLSRDGTHVAWISRRDGNPEVYAVALGGGQAARLTYWNSAQTRVLGWTAEGEVVASSPIGQPFRSRQWAYALPLDGGPGRRLPYGPLNAVARRPDGTTVVQSAVHRDPPTWKRYRGGTAPKLWIDRGGTGSFERLLAELDGQLADPVWVADRLIFISDHEGHGNVYSVRPDGGDLRRHSDHTGSYARDLSGDLEGQANAVAYQRSGRLYLLADFAPDSQPTELDVELPGARIGRQPTVIDIDKALPGPEEASVDETARGAALTVRGTVRWLPTRDGPVRALAADPGVRNRLARALPGGRDAVWVTDADGDDALEFSGPDGRQRIAGGQVGRVLELTVAPDGSAAALATHDGRVLVVALPSGEVRELERTEFGDASGLVFSPDSAWLAWSRAHRSQLRSIRLAEVATGQVHDATPERFVDTSPTFTLDGRYLAFLSARTFDPVYDSHLFDLSFALAERPYLIPLAADTPSPVGPEVAGRPIEDSAGERSDEPVRVRVDVDGLADRAAVLPVPAGRLSALSAAKDGLLWLDTPLTGEIGAGLPEGAKRPRPSLQRWDFPKRRQLRVVGELDWYRVSGDGTRILVRDEESLRVGPADHEVQPKPDEPTAELVDVDLSRLTVTVDPPAEWRQMVVETWRLMRDHFWIADMGGVDWDEVLERYLPVVDRIATRDDLSEVLWEMIGELGASHAYERSPAEPPPPGRAAAFLGADLDRASDGRWRIGRVPPGESSVPTARSPLRAPGVTVQEGDELLAVNGIPIPDAGPGPLLAGLAGKPVELTVQRGEQVRTVAVIPSDDETALRYADWVAGRRSAVHAASEGRIGYVHVPDMVSTGWAEFNRDLRRELQREGLVVDTRDNGGGHVSELVIERLARRPLGGAESRHAMNEEYPVGAPHGPMVSVANEFAGSDGDIVNEAFHELGLGPIVGVRTWGGVIGIDSRYSLVDGTVVTQPRYSFWFRDAGWGVENFGVAPDVEVPTPPHVWASGADPQLDEGVRVVQEQLATFRPLTAPPLESRPDRSPPPLPSRPAS